MKPIASSPLLRRAHCVALHKPWFDDVLGIAAAAGFKVEVVPLAGLNRGVWRGDVLLIGALRNIPRAKDGATRLHFASERGLAARIKQLVVEDKAKVEAADKWGLTPLHWAARQASSRRRKSSCGAAPRSRPRARMIKPR